MAIVNKSNITSYFNMLTSKFIARCDFVLYRASIEHQEYSDNFSDAEDEDIPLAFDDYMSILKLASQNFNAFECIPLEFIEKSHNSLENEPDNIPDLKDYFLFADFIRPGKHKFVLFEHKEFSSFQPLDLIVPYRDDMLKLHKKRVKKLNTMKMFNKNKSVFKPWKADTSKSLRKMFDQDMEYSKIFKVSKDPNEFSLIKDVLYKYVVEIKDVFVYCTGSSLFPYISWLDFSSFWQSWDIIDKNWTIADLDRIFIATNVQLESYSYNPERELWRYEFFEIIVRLAKQKYFSSKICSTIHEAVEKLLLCNILPSCKDYPSWHKWRDMELWTIEVDTLYKSNLESLNKLYSL